jgi:hypothetical protein
VQKVVKRTVVGGIRERLPQHFFDASRQKRKAEQHAEHDDGELRRPTLMQRNDALL